MPTTVSRRQSALAAALAGATLGLTVSYSPEAFAASFSGTGSGFSIPSNNFSTSDITFTNTSTITDITVTLVDLQHSWIGDLVVVLEKLDSGTQADLFHRVGMPDLPFGRGEAVSGNYSFNNAFAGNLWTVAAVGGVIPPGNYFPTGFGSSLASSSLAAFDGQSLAGTWRLQIYNNEGFDTASLGSWELSGNADSTAIPTPAMLPGLIGMGLSFYRKRRADGAEAEAEV